MKLCVNGCQKPVQHPSRVLCAECLAKLDQKINALTVGGKSKEKRMRTLLIVLALALGGCAAQQKQAEEAKDIAIDCTKSELQQAVNDLLPVVLAVINGTSIDWAKMLEGLATEMGENALACTLNRLAAAHPVDPEAKAAARKAEQNVSMSGKAKAQTYLSEKGYRFQ